MSLKDYITVNNIVTEVPEGYYLLEVLADEVGMPYALVGELVNRLLKDGLVEKRDIILNNTVHTAYKVAEGIDVVSGDPIYNRIKEYTAFYGAIKQHGADAVLVAKTSGVLKTQVKLLADDIAVDYKSSDTESAIVQKIFDTHTTVITTIINE